MSKQQDNTQNRGVHLLSAHLDYLRSRGINTETAEKYALAEYNGEHLIRMREEYKITTYPGLPLHPVKGLLVPYPTTSGKVDYWRVRPNVTEYTPKIKHTEEATQSHQVVEPVSIGRWLACSGLTRPFLTYSAIAARGDVSKPIVIAEAPIKAISIEANLDVAAIGLGGVHSGFHCVNEAKEHGHLILHKSLESFLWKERSVYIAYDAGLGTTTDPGNPLVAQGAARLARLLLDRGAIARLVRLPYYHPQDSDPENGKVYERQDQGPDDFIYRNGNNAFRKLMAEAESADPSILIKSMTAGQSKAAVAEFALGLLKDNYTVAFLTEAGIDAFSLAAGPGLSKSTIKNEIKIFKEKLSAKLDHTDEDDSSVLDSILTGYKYVKASTGRVFALEGTGVSDVESSAFVHLICHLFKEKAKRCVNPRTVEMQIAAILGNPKLGIVDPAVRVARQDNTLFLDLADGTQRVIQIKPEGVTIVNECPIPFYRPETQEPLPVPVIYADADQARVALQEFQELLGVNDESMSVCLAWLFSALGMTGTFTVLVVNGERNSGKSSRVTMLRQLIDPKASKLLTMSADERNLLISGEQCHVLAFDNVRSVLRDMSDSLCRLATGVAMEIRSHYRNRDQTVFQLARPIIMNGIGEITDQPDLQSRSLMLTLSKPAAVLTEDVLWQRFKNLHPRVLGALCYLCTQSLGLEATTVVPPSIRMQGPARFAIAAEGPCLVEGSIAAAYARGSDASAIQGLDDPLVSGLMQLIRDHCVADPGATEWLVQPHVLLDSLNVARRTLDLRTPRHLRSKLDHWVGTLRDIGITFDVVGLTSKRPRYRFAWDAGAEWLSPYNDSLGADSDDVDPQSSYLMSQV